MHSVWKPHPGQIPIGKALFIQLIKDIILECGRKFGKALCVDTIIPTPYGDKTMAELRPGDYVWGDDGKPTQIVFKSDIQERESFEVEFCNGEIVVACEDHNWMTYTKLDRKKIKRKDRGCHPDLKTSIRTTKEISESIMHGKEFNHSIPYAKSIQSEESYQLIDPYLLGCWLGDGGAHGARMASIDEEILDAFRSLYGVSHYGGCDYGVTGGFLVQLRALNLLDNKHIPKEYLMASESQKLALLQGLMDTDGTINKEGNLCCFDNTNKDLADGVFYLVSSLGMKANRQERIGKLYGVEKKLCYRVLFKPLMNVFRLTRKTDKIIPNKIKSLHHTIVNVRPVGIKKVQCISVDNKSHLYLCSRSFIPTHNTDLLIYCLYRWALTYPGTFNYYFAPFSNQIDDLVWKNGRMPGFLPDHMQKKYIKSINNSDKRIMFNNNSFIKCDGADNYEKARGYSPTGLSTYDETKDFRKEFHVGYDPNRAITDAPLLAVGSPGGGENLLSQLWDSANVSTYGSAFRAPSHMNPHISAAYLEKKRLEHIARDELEVYQQEYLAMRVKLGTKYIFPMLSTAVVQPYGELLAYVMRHRKDYDFFISADPGSAKCFAVLFGVVHRYDKHVIILDEIYETKLGQNSVGVMAPRILEKINEINRNYDDWMACYDHAATWFFSELVGTMPDFPINFIKCEKDLNNKEAKLSMIKDMIITKVFTMTDRCIKLYWEMENYKRGDNGIVKKEDDHAIDTCRYLLNLANYEFTPEARPVNYRSIIQRREFKEDDMFEKKFTGEGYGDFDSWNSDN